MIISAQTTSQKKTVSLKEWLADARAILPGLKRWTHTGERRKTIKRLLNGVSVFTLFRWICPMVSS
jgi:hypothetical protein